MNKNVKQNETKRKEKGTEKREVEDFEKREKEIES